MIASLLGASIGVPYAVSHSQFGTSGGEATAEANDTAAAASSAATPSQPIAPATIVGVAPATAQPYAPGAQSTNMQQVLRFDLTRQWVYQAWPRKTTGPTDVGLESVRVPLVTGTGIYDLAGSLTYYFNAYGQVEHISFRGRTGDAARLVQFLMRTYEFQREAAPPGEQLYQVKRTGRPQSELCIRSESVLRRDAPNSSYAVELELARPGSKRLLPERWPVLQIPQVAAAATTGEATANANSESDGRPDDTSYLDKLRFATPDEESQVQRMRWPD
jgi:hypothetical protein